MGLAAGHLFPSPLWGGRTAAEGGAPGGVNPCDADRSPRLLVKHSRRGAVTPPVSLFPRIEGPGSERFTLPIEGRERSAPPASLPPPGAP